MSIRLVALVLAFIVTAAAPAYADGKPTTRGGAATSGGKAKQGNPSAGRKARLRTSGPGSTSLVGDDAPRYPTGPRSRSSSSGNDSTSLVGDDAPRYVAGQPRSSGRSSASLVGDDAPRYKVKVATGTKTAIKRAVDDLIRSRSSISTRRSPKVRQILITATRPGPSGASIVSFDARVGMDWFRGIHATVSASRAGKLRAGQLTFDSISTDRNLAGGDISLEGQAR